MKKGQMETWVLLGVFLVVVILAFLYVSGLLFEVFPSQLVWCNDFNFIGCVEDTGNPEFFSVGSYRAKQCPTTASRCEASTPSPGYLRIYQSCEERPALIGTSWVCSGLIKEQSAGSYSPGVGETGWWFKSDGAVGRMKVFNLKLFDCGRSACAYFASGIPLTTSGCTWITDLRVYDPTTGSLIKTPEEGKELEYTIPPGKSYLYTTGNLRRACGEVGEFCDLDSDCITGHTYQYQGFGAECQSKQLILYGCRKYDATCLEKDILPDGTEICVGDYATESRCEAVQTIPIGCCPQSDYCGPNAFCDPETFTCKSSGQVECTADWECGIATACDYSTRALKKPTCEAGKCVAKEIQSVECCFDENCPSGWYCGTDYKCYEGITPKAECPFECCERESQYFDKPCPPDKQCVNRQCVGQGGDGFPRFDTGMIFGLIAGVLAFLLMGRNAIKDRDWVGIAIAGIVGLVAGIAVWWIINNWVLLLIGGILGGIFGGLLIWIFGPIILAIIVFIIMIIREIRGK